jgi:surface antigen
MMSTQPRGNALRRFSNMVLAPTLVVCVSAALVGLTALPAQADIELCSGYSSCVSNGYTDHGYEAKSGTSYWGMFAGHNCTNYVAYVLKMINGAPTPSTGLGNGSEWDTNATVNGYQVDDVPALGAVAQWEDSGGHPGGHVAYVEAVNSNGSIWVSQDSYPAGPFTWKGLSVGSSDWPDHFIHFDQRDANPSSAVGSSGSVHTLQVAVDGCAKVFRRDLGDSGFGLVTQVGVSCGWSRAGATDMAMMPATNDQARMALLKSDGLGVAGCGELYLYGLDGGTATKLAELGSCGWSTNAPPSVTVDSSGNTYVAATKYGRIWVFRRDVNGTLTQGEVGNGSWSGLSGPAVQAAPDGKIWIVATKDNGDVWTFVRQPDDSWDNQGDLGGGNWSVVAQPGLAVDDDGDVTVAVVKQGAGAGGDIHSYRRCSTCTQWHYVGEVGTSGGWSISGTLSMMATPNDHVSLAAIKHSSASGSTAWSFDFTPDPSQNYLGSWSGGSQVDNGGWSQHSAPTVAVASGGTVFITAVKSNGDMWAFKRSTSGSITSYGQIGGSGWAGKAP